MKNRKAFITGISSTYLKKKEIDFLKTNKPWGVILFSRNINNFDQTKLLINQIKSCFHDNKPTSLTRLIILKCISYVVKSGMNLIGVNTPNKM